jgi:ATP-dependent Clp protease adaptor protein ClpS
MSDDAATTTIEPPAVRPKSRPQDKRKTKRQPPYHVILWNDEDHTDVYVIQMMRQVFGHAVQRGMLIAKEVDSSGRAIVMTTTRELAELKRDQIHAYGRDDLVDGCVGAMWASIEPAPGD